MASLELDRLAGHMAWADALIWQAVLANEIARRDERMRELLHHIHQVQWIYLRIWRGEPLVDEPLTHFERLDDIAAWGRRFHREAPAALEAMTEDGLAGDVEFPWREMLLQHYGSLNPTDLRDTVLQIAQHTTHHRAQIAARLRELGGEPPLADYIAWCWAGRPAAVWPAHSDSVEVP